MAVQTSGTEVGIWTAAVDLSAVANQFRCVKVTGAFAVNLTTVAGEGVAGILQNKPALGEAAGVRISGVSKCVAGAAIAANAKVMAGADGRILTAATLGSKIIGEALEAAAAANEIITVLINSAGDGVV